MSQLVEKNRIFNNFFWSFGEKIGAQGVSLIVSIVVARLLDPDVFGTVALIMVFINILQVFVDSGFGSALIQKKDADNLDFSTAFYANVFVCIFLYTLIYLTAPLIAEFYKNNGLTIYIRVLGICIIVYGLKNIQHTYVAKNLMFRKFFWATIGGTVVSGVVGIFLACNGYGIWAIIFQHLTNVFIDTMVLWIIVKWRPKLKFSFERLKQLFKYGWKILAANVIDCFYIEFKNLLVGKYYSTSDLAFFNRGELFPKVIVTNIDLSIDSVLFPVLSNYQEKKEELKTIVQRAITTSVFIMAPLMIGLAVVAPQVVSIVLTDKWLPCVPYLRIFCITYLFYPIHTANLNAIKAVGRSDLFLKLEIYKILVALMLLLLLIRYSVFIMACGLILSSFISQLINAWPNKKLIDYGYLKQLMDISPYLVVASIMGVIVYCVGLLNINIWILLLLQVFIGAVVYVALCYILKLNSYIFVFNLIKKKLKKV